MVYAIAMVKDEADIVGETVLNMTRQCDKVIVADNGSTDGTREILADMPGVTLIDDPDPRYYQSKKMSRLAELCVEAGASWVVPFDADEMHYAHGGLLRTVLPELPGEVVVSESLVFDHVATSKDTPNTPPVQRMQHRRAAPLPLRKVAVRAVPGVVIHEGNHGASFPDIPHPATVTNLTEVRHFPYRSVEQFVGKVRNGAAGLAATDLPETSGAHWRQYGKLLENGGEAAISEVFHTYFYRQDPDREKVIGTETQPPLALDPCPKF